MSSVIRLAGVAFVGALLVPAVAHADVAWVPPNGGNSLFSYSNGYNSNGFFGNPVLIGNTFVFTPPAFTAVNPNQTTRSDQLQVTIVAQPGQTITGVIIREFGIRTSEVLTTVQGTLFITNLTDTLGPTASSLTYDSALAWSGLGSRSFSYDSNTPFQLALTDNLAALIPGQNITKTRVEIEILPSPASAVVLAGAGLVLAGRRRR